MRHDRDLVIHADAVLRHVQLLLTKLEDAELGQRGYLITGDAEYLEPYSDALKDVSPDNSANEMEQRFSILQEIEYLRKLTQDNPLQQRNLGELDADAKELLKYLASTIGLRKTRETLAVDLHKLDPNYGKQLMDGIRQEIHAMTVEESHLLAARLQNEETSLRQSSMLAFFSIAFFYIGMLSVVWAVTGHAPKPEDITEKLGRPASGDYHAGR